MLTPWPHHAEGNWIAARAYHALGRDADARHALDRALSVWSDAEEGYEPAEEAQRFARSLVGE